MWSEIRQALLSVTLDERQVTPMVQGGGTGAGLAALGSVVGQLVTTIRRDRRILSKWLSAAEVRL
jgi:hypothetical protein